MTAVIIHIHLHIPGDIVHALRPLLAEMKGSIMSELSDLIAQIRTAVSDLHAAVDDAVTRDTADHAATRDQIAALGGQVADLEAKVAAGLATPDDMAALKALSDELAALKASVAGLDLPASPPVEPMPTEPVSPEPTPDVTPIDPNANA